MQQTQNCLAAVSSLGVEESVFNCLGVSGSSVVDSAVCELVRDSALSGKNCSVGVLDCDLGFSQFVGGNQSFS